jgi:hypothetical protein
MTYIVQDQHRAVGRDLVQECYRIIAFIEQIGHADAGAQHPFALAALQALLDGRQRVVEFVEGLELAEHLVHAGFDQMHMRILESRHHHAPAEIDDLRIRAGSRENIFLAANRDDHAAFIDGHRLGFRRCPVDRVNFCIGQHQRRADSGLGVDRHGGKAGNNDEFQRPIPLAGVAATISSDRQPDQVDAPYSLIAQAL